MKLEKASAPFFAIFGGYTCAKNTSGRLKSSFTNLEKLKNWQISAYMPYHQESG